MFLCHPPSASHLQAILTQNQVSPRVPLPFLAGHWGFPGMKSKVLNGNGWFEVSLLFQFLNIPPLFTAQIWNLV